jgi:uncharacterized repeat protein (TIGR02543 family)
MKIILSSKGHHHVARLSIFFITVALIGGMVGCAPTPTQYDLTISSTAGGSVTTPDEGTFTYDAGTVVGLEATPDAGYQFVNWTGDVGTVANVNAATTTITMNGNYAITANFEEIAPQLLAGEDCRVVMREWIGGPVWYQPDVPNGVILFIDEPCESSHSSATGQVAGIMSDQVQIEGATVDPYEVEGSTKEEVTNDIFDPESGKGTEVEGVRYAGSHELDVQFSWNQTGTNPETGNLTIHISNVTWTLTVRLPDWTPPDDAAECDVQAWHEFMEELIKHEQGHVDIAQAGMEAVQAAVVCTTIEVAPGATDEEIDAAVGNNITGSEEWLEMQQAQDNYDAPHDPDANPTGTNHGTENNQNAVLCGG